MKKGLKNFRFFSLATLGIIVVVFIYLTSSAAVTPDSNGAKYLIGMSQCNLGEPWRIQMNEDLRDAAERYPDIKLIFTDAAQDSQKQIQDVKNLMKLDIDLLIISPNEFEPLTPILSEVYKEIPVIVLDRKIKSNDYTLFIGADNEWIGRRAGEYVKNLLGEEDGNIVEIMGLPGALPTTERSVGFRESISSAPNIKIQDELVADWLRDTAEIKFLSYLRENPDQHIDVVYAHNDPMAYGAYKAAKQMGREEEMIFIGVDGLSDEEGGINLVRKGIINITFIYPSGGKTAIEYAVRILNGEKIEQKEVPLDSILIDAENCYEYPVKN